jgi:hypothetical protein
VTTLLLGITSLNQISYAENNNPPVVITQVEIDSPLAFYPDNSTCTSPPQPGFINNCLTDLVPGHKVQCGFFIGSSTCEPIHQYTTGTNQSCFSNYETSSGPQWFDIYNTLDATVDLQNFTALNKLNYGPYGQEGPFSTILEMKPHERCTFAWQPVDESLSLDLNNVSMGISYKYNGKDYNVATPYFSDTYNDTRTWQFDGNKWTFAEQNTVTVPEFPSWLKNNAKLWSEGSLDKSYFVQVLYYLIENDMKTMLPEGTLTFIHPSIAHLTTIPSWIKNDAGWWADDKISDMDFLNAMYYLLDKGIIRL